MLVFSGIRRNPDTGQLDVIKWALFFRQYCCSVKKLTELKKLFSITSCRVLIEGIYLARP